MQLQGRNLQQQLTGADVKLLQDELVQLGYSIPPQELQQSYFGDGTLAAVKAFQNSHNLPLTGIVDQATATAINAALAEQPPAPAKVEVTGHIYTHELTGLEGARVVVVDKYLGGEDLLGTAVTNAKGSYTISCDLTPLAQRQKEKPDIQVKVTSPSNLQSILVTSPIHYNAGKKVTLNLIIPADKLERPVEYQRLTRDLTKYIPAALGGLDKLREDDERQDITYLANKTGWDARMVAMTALAQQFQKESEIPAEFYYALFRSGLPANLDLLSQAQPQTVAALWNKAIEAKVIPAEMAAQIPQNLERFQQQGTQRLLTRPPRVGFSRLQDLLSISLGNQQTEAQKLRFAELYYHNRGNLPQFWQQVQGEFGEESTQTLRLNCKLSFLTLNNVPLIQELHRYHSVRHANGNARLTSPLDLIRDGLYKLSTWESLLRGIDVPAEIPGDTPAAKKTHYVDFIVSQLKLSYPTAVVAEMVNQREISLPVEDTVRGDVYAFLTRYQGRFELGMHSIEGFLLANNLTLDSAPLVEVKRLHRAFQISPTDEAMAVLINRQIDSAYKVIQYDKEDFIRNTQSNFGSEMVPRMIYNKALEVHNATFNMAISYFSARSALPVFAIPPAISDTGTSGADTDDDPMEPQNLAPAILENIFGEMDYCACQHCRSWLSPAAYLVDLLTFIDYSPDSSRKPVDVLLERRPDIAHLQLTCENTNTVLPYIDLVNEILEYYVVHHDTWEFFEGHNIDPDISTEDLLANPQFVNEGAYQRLKQDETGKVVVYPLGLPFNQPLETLRRYFNQFKLPLHQAMEQLRQSNALDNPDRSGVGYGWRDILIEQLQLSRQEYLVLTDSTLPLADLFGETGPETDIISNLSNVKTFARKVDISYKDLVELLKTQFINPHSHLIPKLEKLEVSLTQIGEFCEGRLTDTQFERLRTPDEDLDLSKYGGNVHRWIRDNYAAIQQLILLSDPNQDPDVESFVQLQLSYALPDLTTGSLPDLTTGSQQLTALEFRKLLRFIRLWKKLDWSIPLVDKAIAALYPRSLQDTSLATYLDEDFKELITRLAIIKRVLETLGLDPKRDLLRLLTCWSTIDTHGSHSLYRQMFLNPTILKLDPVFDEDGYGHFPRGSSERIADHKPALQAAFNLTPQEFNLIGDDLSFADEHLTLENISRIFAYGYLAKQLKISVQELIALKHISGIDPFGILTYTVSTTVPPQYQPPAILQFIELAQLIARSSFKMSQLMYFLQHENLSGKASPRKAQILAFAKTLRDDLTRIQREHSITDDPTGELAKAKIALVYGHAVADTFFGLLNETSVYSIPYSHGTSTLEESITDITDKLTYDNFRKELSYRGVMTTTVRDNFRSLSDVSDEFKTAVTALFNQRQSEFTTFFDRYPDLKKFFEAYQTTPDLSEVLNSILPTLQRGLKVLQLKQTISAELGAELPMVNLLLETPALVHAFRADPVVPLEPAVKDFLSLETSGISAQFFFTDDLTTPPDKVEDRVPEINYSVNNPLPTNTITSDAPIIGIWSGYLEVPANGFYNFYIEADSVADDDVSLELDGVERSLSRLGDTWRNHDAIELKVGQLYALKLTVNHVTERLVLKWESRGFEQTSTEHTYRYPQGIARTSIPSTYLYPSAYVERFTDTYLRLLKVLAMVDALQLSVQEVEYFGSHAGYFIHGEAWLNALPTSRPTREEDVQQLLTVVSDLMRYEELKRSFKVKDESLIRLLEDREAKTEEGESLLRQVTSWEENAITVFDTHLQESLADLSNLHKLIRLKAAFDVAKTLRIEPTALLECTTNEPDQNKVRRLQEALRAHYDESAWRKLVQPINDELRSLQRDALVAFVLHMMQQDNATSHINTPNKLFEYFLIDVEMAPCMKTSRIKQAISTVQLFIDRCLLNLEKPDVAPSAIRANEWKWRKPYRVWEVNRKVFLFPENWLGPELRDNKSSFFRDLESELLQSDITDEAAATAYVHYLEKLDEVANLEICGTYYEEKEISGKRYDIVHVIGRTTGARRQYYYRRQEGISWTPWEKIGVNIEDNPVLPVIWKGRLFLFWFSVMAEALPELEVNHDLPSKKSKEDGSEENGDDNTPNGDDNTPNGDDNTPKQIMYMSIDEIMEDTNATTAANTEAIRSVVLYWSEYCQGRWQPPKTSDVTQGLKLDRMKLNDFKREDLQLVSYVDKTSGDLYIDIHYSDEPSYYGRYTNKGHFKLYNAHSLPLGINDSLLEPSSYSRGSYEIPDKFQRPIGGRNLRFLPKGFTIDYSASASDSITFGSGYSTISFQHLVLGKPKANLPVQILKPIHFIQNIFEAPFFFRDAQHTFHVQPKLSWVPLEEPLDFVGISGAILEILEAEVLTLFVEPDPLALKTVEEVRKTLVSSPTLWPPLEGTLPVKGFVTQHPYIKQAIDLGLGFWYGTRLIGPSGGL